MPAYRFSWDTFDDRSVLAFAQSLGYSGDAEGARTFLRGHVKRPDDDFIHRTRDAIATVWLPQHLRVGLSIVRELWDRRAGGMGEMPTDAEGCGRYVLRCRNTSGLRAILCQRLISFGDADREDPEEFTDEFVPRFSTIVPKKQTLVQPRPYPHQEEAWRALDEHLRDPKAKGTFKGVLVMPTGAGKTQTAVHWLLRRHVDGGGRVLWLAHREELLRQAARTFHRFAALAPSREGLRVRLVSRGHCRFHQIDPADDIVLCSVQSLARGGAEATRLLQDPNLFVVVDEAHHAPAKSYRDAIEVLAASASHKLLGLTATPTRTAEKERPELSRLFGGRELFQVTAGELIAKELLARPIPSTVPTHVDAEEGMTGADFSHLVSWGEPSAEMLAALGRNEQRNAVITSHYLANREKYGKTLVFTTDVLGAAQLADAFREKGVPAEYVASYHPDAQAGQPFDNRAILDRYRDPRSGVDVLINVEMLTEGVDLPMTRTVFLARPTSSEVLLRQMIGRALRGPAAGGNAFAHIVAFEDQWREYRDYLSPMNLLSDYVESEAPATGVGTPLEQAETAANEPPVSWGEVIGVARAIRSTIADADADVFEAVPDGMFFLEVEQEGEVTSHVVHVYAHQRSCWDALIKALWSMAPEKLAALDRAAVDNEYFGDVEEPKPGLLDVARMIEAASRGAARPEYVALAGREHCNPRTLAALARDKDLRASEMNALVAERHVGLAKRIYPTLLEFRRAFDDAMREHENPGAASPPKGEVLFELPSNMRMRPGPHHNLDKLLEETLAQGSELLGRPLHRSGSIVWTDKPIKGWFGIAYFRGPKAGRIRINVVLNSPDVSAECVRFLLWHEFLHIHLAALHTEEFRRHERMWPNHATLDRELDALEEKFGIEYWR